MKAFLSSVAACLCLGALAELPAPELFVSGYVNGTMNVAVTTAGGVSYEIEMKGPGAADYEPVSFMRDSDLIVNSANSLKRSFYYLPTNYVGEASFRVRAVSNGVVSAWTDCGTHKATLNATGTLISSAVEGASNVQSPLNAVDGRLRTFCDFTSDSGNDKWVGWLYDSEIAIKAIRFLPRGDLILGRYRGSYFQAASYASFSDATNIHQVSWSYVNGKSVVEVPLDPPVRARAFRHWKEAGGYEQTAEMEFIPVEMPLKPDVSVVPGDLTNFSAVVSASFPPQMFCSSFRIERAYQKDGPWTAVTEWTDPADAAPFTDASLHVGVPVHYRVAAVTQHPDWAGDVVHSAISTYTRLRRLDRAWSDETKLLDGLALMTQTNGVANAGGPKGYNLAFDGDTGTAPDTYAPHNADGPVGLDFGRNVWVGGFGYVCRNDSYCYRRIQCAALYCASGEDAELLDKVQCSSNVERYSQDTTFYYQAATKRPAAGARCWFLYGNRPCDEGGFYGNVAELAFFGWTQDDLDAAPVLGTPGAPSFVRGDKSVTLTWDAALHAASYSVQRRARGTEEWETRAEGLAGTSYLDAVESDADTFAYEYRVVADGGELGTSASDAAAFFHYRLADGTGLRAAAWWPYSRTSCEMGQLSNVAARGVEAVDLAVPAGAELVPGATEGVKFVWTGKVVCPAGGTYTFRLDADAGGCVRVDGNNTVNDATATPPSGAITLKAGEHDIRVEYLCTGTAGTRKCRLLWSGPMAEEAVPASQLRPSDEIARPAVDGWDVDVFVQNRCNFFEKAGEGVYRFTSGCATWTSLETGNYQFMSRPWSGNFDFSATIYARDYGHVGLMVRDAEGHAYFPHTLNQWNVQYFAVWGIPSGETKRKTLADNVKMANNVAPTYIRFTRIGALFTVYTRKTADGEWEEQASWTDAGFPRETWIGIAATSWNAYTVNLFTVEASDVELKAFMQPTVLIFR